MVLSERMKGDASFDKSCPYPVYRHDFRFISSGAVKKYCKGYTWLRKFIENHLPIDIIISNCRDMSSVTALAVSRTLRIPFVIFTHGLEINRKEIKERLIIRILLKESNLVISNSTYTQSLVRKFGVSQHRIAVVPGAIAFDEYAVPSCNSPVSRSAGKKTTTKKMILTCGKLTERKGHDMVIKALPEVLKESASVNYVIAGTGPYETNLRSLVRALKLGDKVRFRGRVSNVELRHLYRTCDVFVMPNRELDDGNVEGFGLVFLEANAFGKPVVAGRSGGAVDAVEHGKTGLLVNPMDKDEIAWAISYLLRNRKVAARMGSAGRKRAEHKFTWKISGEKLRKALVNLTK
jgi:phosphatidylinositol alpha-1,6-mannosyltransferase